MRINGLPVVEREEGEKDKKKIESENRGLPRQRRAENAEGRGEWKEAVCT